MPYTPKPMSNQSVSAPFFACPDCDLLIDRRQGEAGYALYCPRCGCLLQKKVARSVEKSMALSIAGIFLFFPTLFLPLLTFEVFGFSDSAHLLHSILHLFSSKFYFVACMVALFAAIFPFTILSLGFSVSLFLHFRIRSRWTAPLFRTYLHLSEWAMMEVYLLGVLVAIIKMISIAKITFLFGFFCFAGLAILIILLSLVIDKTYFWERIEELQPPAEKRPNTTIFPQKSTNGRSASSYHLLRCHSCDKLLAQEYAGGKCPRCGASLHLRKTKSRERSWALVCTAAILLLPANAIPVMTVNLLEKTNSSTIIDGIIYFFTSGSYLVGAIIFTASVLVPFFKVIGLYFLLCDRAGKSNAILRKRTKIYRFIAFIGRWSMLDIFVVALLSSSVNFGVVSSTWIAPGARWFCLVVVTTMLAVINFDPRLMWDNSQKTIAEK